MKHKIKKSIFAIALIAIIMPIAPLLAKVPPLEKKEISQTITEINSDAITASDIGATNESQINNATNEATETVTTTGTLIEIGNTTAEETTIVVRTTDKNKKTEDVILKVPMNKTTFTTDTNVKSNLNDWLVSDQITFTAQKNLNSGLITAKKIKNNSFKKEHKSVNGWIKKIRANKNEIDVNLGKNIYTINLTEAKITMGENIATINDLSINDRIRLRVIDDKDKNPATWKAKTLTVLRSGDNNFAQATHAIIRAKITNMPINLNLPTIIEAEILPSKFYKKDETNKLIRAPGSKIYIYIIEDTKLVRRFLGKALITEMNVDDIINIIGQYSKNIGDPIATSDFYANVIQDESIQVLGVAQRLGKITAIDTIAKTVTITVLPEKNKKETVLFKTTDQTKIFRDNKKASISDLVIDDIVKTKGVYNRNERAVKSKVINVISQTKIDDFSKRINEIKFRD